MLQIARDIISAKGLRELKVRDVAEAADCSIGSVYNEFGDFDGLILTVNRETVQALTARLAGVRSEDPMGQLHGLAATYLEFASEHANLLRSLFEHRMENDRPFPEDILIMVMQAFALMHDPLVRLMPDRDLTEIALQARMMFSAVHGIISLGSGGAYGRGAAGAIASTASSVRRYLSGWFGSRARIMIRRSLAWARSCLSARVASPRAADDLPRLSGLQAAKKFCTRI